MAPQVWTDVDDLLRYLSVNWPFDSDEPWVAKIIPLDSKHSGGDTPLHMVAAWDDVLGVNLLLDAGASIDELGDMSYTPLATAVSTGSVAAAQVLLKRGANPAMATEFGQTPIQMAMRDGSAEMREVFRDLPT